MPHHRARHGCLRCFAHKDGLNQLDQPAAPRPHQWFCDIARTCLFDVPLTEVQVPVLLRNLDRRRGKGGLVLKRKLDGLPDAQRGDRLEPTFIGEPDFVHGERLCDFPPAKRR
eukprot:4561934-Pyramimonas_sp.AAC.1